MPQIKRINGSLVKSIKPSDMKKQLPLLMKKALRLDLSGMNIQEVKIEDSFIEETKFVKAYMAKSSFARSTLNDVDMTEINLSEANFSNASLTDVNFRHAGLADVDFTNTSFDDCRLANAHIGGAIFRNVKLNGLNFNTVTGIGQAKFEGAFFIVDHEIVTVIDFICVQQRTDGHIALAYLTNRGVLITAGCQTHLGTDSYRAHIREDYYNRTQDETDETLAIMDHIDERAAIVAKRHAAKVIPTLGELSEAAKALYAKICDSANWYPTSREASKALRELHSLGLVKTANRVWVMKQAWVPKTTLPAKKETYPD